jgi:hypothetical protein
MFLLLLILKALIVVERLHVHTANKFGLMYSRKRISQNSFPNFIYILYFHSHQCCGSGMFIPDPGSWIPDLESRIQKQVEKRGVKKNFLSNIFL